MTDAPHRSRSICRVRLDDCDRTRTIGPGRLLAIADELRFDFYEALTARGVRCPTRQAIRAERIAIDRAPRARESIVVEVFLGRVGTTSLDVEQLVTAESGEVLARMSSTVVGLDASGSPEPVDRALTDHLHAPLGVLVETPREPDGSVAFLRTLDAWPSHENTGGHVARTRMVEWILDAYRVGARREAFEHVGANEPRALRSLALVYEKESFSGDGLRIAVASASSNVFDATLIRGGVVVTRARFETVAS